MKKKYTIKGTFADYLNVDVYDALFIKTSDGDEVCLNEVFHHNIKKDAEVVITIKFNNAGSN
jgi:hypothetical protein